MDCRKSSTASGAYGDKPIGSFVHFIDHLYSGGPI